MNSPPAGFTYWTWKEELKRALPTLDRARRSALAAACAERLYPAIDLFYRIEAPGHPGLFLSALEAAWECPVPLPRNSARHAPSSGIQELIVDCSDQVPDTEDYASDLGAAALSAESSIIYSLQSCVNDSPEFAYYAANMELELVDLYLSSLLPRQDLTRDFDALKEESRKQDQAMSSHPLMRDAIERQRVDLTELINTPEVNVLVLRRLRLRARESAPRDLIQHLAHLSE